MHSDRHFHPTSWPKTDYLPTPISNGFSLDCGGQGDCFFRSVAAATGRSTEQHAGERLRACGFFGTNSAVLRLFIRDELHFDLRRFSFPSPIAVLPAQPFAPATPASRSQSATLSRNPQPPSPAASSSPQAISPDPASSA
ncbi:hypothetical protein PAPYR_10423 [Paratrimastix pyriformis]|uniref:OTU domain-containing protein n=1 Tax=Paratrimastix pyriformis TaxID=342808 RepID=A0ABQ8UBM1_9EUKA|nr:hypothetical protein PAPYR_10423 [Paratrimastix pyriformis]